MKNRTLKVVKSFSTKPKAHLPLSGLWLERAGFTIGTEVSVIVKDKCLIILPKTYETKSQ